MGCLDGEPGYLDSVPCCGSRHQLQLQGVLGRCLQGLLRRDWVPLQLSPATCVSNCSLTISALTGGNGWRCKQGVLEGGSSRHPFSSAVFREIPILEDYPCSKWLCGTWNQLQALLKIWAPESQRWWNWAFEDLSWDYLEWKDKSRALPQTPIPMYPPLQVLTQAVLPLGVSVCVWEGPPAGKDLRDQLVQPSPCVGGKWGCCMDCGGGAQPPDGRARTKTKSVVADGRQATCCGEAALWEALGSPSLSVWRQTFRRACLFWPTYGECEVIWTWNPQTLLRNRLKWLTQIGG